jgi:glucose-1-phosphate thymidylyltransferase
MWGIVPAAGKGSRIQPLAFSKELLPVGSRSDGSTERPIAVSEYLLERMILGGVTKICFVVSPGKSDILEYFGTRFFSADVCYTVQTEALGLCDALFKAHPFINRDEPVVIGLPDTIWFPVDGLARLPDDELSFLLFPVEYPEFFDATLCDSHGRVLEIRVKRKDAGTNWIWGAFKMPGHVFAELHRLWCNRNKQDQYIGTLVNAWLAEGGRARGVHAGEGYVDVGTIHGYREAMRILVEHDIVETGEKRNVSKTVQRGMCCK